MHFTGAKSSPKMLLLLKTNFCKLAWRLPNLCNASPLRNNLIKLTHYDGTKKMAHNSQIVRTKENHKLSYGGLSQRQASGTN